jgi:uncharacterized protein
MRSRQNLPALFALLFVPLAAASQTAPSEPAARTAPAGTIPAANKPSCEQLLTLFEVMRLRQQMQDLLKMLPAALEQQLQGEQEEVELSLAPAGGGDLTAEQKATRDRITKKYFEQAERIYPMDEMLSDMVEVYQRHLTREDVDGILAFYRSPAGQHLVEAQPLMAREVMPAVTKKMEARSKDLVDRYKKELNDAMGPPKIPPTAAPKT